LEHLDLSKNGLKNESVIDFADTISRNRSFITINLRNNQIGKDGGQALRMAVSAHLYMIGIYLEDNAI
jgi:Ran GTPase-activating protein (RanGAP) involved in mRNA processing and transport